MALDEAVVDKMILGQNIEACELFSIYLNGAFHIIHLFN